MSQNKTKIHPTTEKNIYNKINYDNTKVIFDKISGISIPESLLKYKPKEQLYDISSENQQTRISAQSQLFPQLVLQSTQLQDPIPLS